MASDLILLILFSTLATSSDLYNMLQYICLTIYCVRQYISIGFPTRLLLEQWFITVFVVQSVNGILPTIREEQGRLPSVRA